MKFIKKILCLLIITGQLVVLAGCPNNYTDEVKRQSVFKFGFFDTVSYVYSYANDKEEVFNNNANKVFEILEEYHKLFDIYNIHYDQEDKMINNLYTVNKNAGKEPVVVDQKLIDFLLYTKEIYEITNGETNVMFGSVLNIWHKAREKASLLEIYEVPKLEDLEKANAYTSIELLKIDDEKNTVFIADANARIDVGAIGKGYATEKAGQYLESIGCKAYVLNIGGNLRVIGEKLDGSGWPTGVTNPRRLTIDDPTYAIRINIKDTSCVTSGDYERYYFCDGKRYHHIIDKDTLMPSEYFSSITILVKDSGLADALSTALFSMSYEDGKALVDTLEEDVEVIWIDLEGNVTYTDGIVPIES